MDAQTGRKPAPPAPPAPPSALRPAQLGIVLVGRVTLTHIGATVVDLADRGFLTIEFTEDLGPDWRLTLLAGEPQNLLDYERTLLRGLFSGRTTMAMEHLTIWMMPVLDKVRSEIVRDATRSGWLRPRLSRRFAVTRGQRRRHDQNPGKRTKAGEKLLKDIKAFKRELRALAGADDTRTLPRSAAYAMIFGLAAPLPAANSASEDPDQRAQSTAFAASWLEECGGARQFAPIWSWSPWQSSDPADASVHGHGHGHQGHGYGHGYGGHSGYGGGGFGGHGGGHV